MSAVKLQGVKKQWPELCLGPLDIDIGKGEFFGIFGPPLTGKSSLLKIVLGLLSIDEGEVWLDGEPARDMAVAERGLAMVFQNLALFPHMSGRDNICFALKEQGLSDEAIDAKLAHVSGVLHVEHILHKTPSQMSGGERQRIALGRALATDAKVLLLDEPISALDARLREEMRVELKRLQREEDQTFIYVSHDEEEVMAVSDRLAVIVDGTIGQIGTPEEIYHRPANKAVAEIVGSPPMNFFSGELAVNPTGGSTFSSPVLGSLSMPFDTRTPLELTLGLRPEDIRLSDEPADAAFSARLESVEPLGAYTIVNAMVGEQLLKFRVNGQWSAAANTSLSLDVDHRRLHFFSASGERWRGNEQTGVGA